MPFTAQCPHCRTAKFKVPWRKQEQSMACPKCQQEFVLLPEDVPQQTQAVRPGGPVPERTKSAPVLLPEATADCEEPRPTIEVPYAVALASVIIVGMSVILAYIPFGRFVSIVLAPIGIFAAFLSLLSLDYHKKVAWIGLIGNSIVMLLLVIWPSLFGTGNWLPPPDPNEGQDQIFAVSREGQQLTPATSVDASKAVWQQLDCRIDLVSCKIGPEDPKAKTPEQRNAKVMRLTLNVSNVGVFRPLEIKPLPEPPHEIRLHTANGIAIARKSIDVAKPITIYPGKSQEIVLMYAVPAEPWSEMKLELPSLWLGHRDPAIIMIPVSMIGKR